MTKFEELSALFKAGLTRHEKHQWECDQFLRKLATGLQGFFGWPTRCLVFTPLSENSVFGNRAGKITLSTGDGPQGFLHFQDGFWRTGLLLTIYPAPNEGPILQLTNEIAVKKSGEGFDVEILSKSIHFETADDKLSATQVFEEFYSSLKRFFEHYPQPSPDSKKDKFGFSAFIQEKPPIPMGPQG